MIIHHITRGWKKLIYFVFAYLGWYLLFKYLGFDITKSSIFSSTYVPGTETLSSIGIIQITFLFGGLIGSFFSVSYMQYRLMRECVCSIKMEIIHQTQILTVYLSDLELGISAETKKTLTSSLQQTKKIGKQIREYLLSKYSLTNSANDFVIDNMIGKMIKLNIEESKDDSISKEDIRSLKQSTLTVQKLLGQIESIFQSIIPSYVYDTVVIGTHSIFTLMIPVLWSNYSWVLGTTISLLCIIMMLAVFGGIETMSPVYSIDEFWLDHERDDISKRIKNILNPVGQLKI
jgi:hypothetical protein